MKMRRQGARGVLAVTAALLAAGVMLQLSGCGDDDGAPPPWAGPEAQEAYLKASNTEANDRFGTTVAVDGDTVVVGAYYEDSNDTGTTGAGADNSGWDSGAAYVFVRSGGVWTQEAYLKASNTDAGDGFGDAVAVAGDTVVVGAFWEDSNETGTAGTGADNSALQSGAVYVFDVSPLTGLTLGPGCAPAAGSPVSLLLAAAAVTFALRRRRSPLGIQRTPA